MTKRFSGPLLFFIVFIILILTIEGVGRAADYLGWISGSRIDSSVRFMPPFFRKEIAAQFAVKRNPIKLPTWHHDPDPAVEGELRHTINPAMHSFLFHTPEGLLANQPGSSTVKETFNNDLVYEVTYNFDKYQMREFSKNNLELPYHFLTMGCSQTLGEGLPVEQTLAAYFAKINTQFEPYILAQSAADPAQILALSKKFSSFQGLKQKRGIAVFRLFDFHFHRTIKSIEYKALYPDRAFAHYDQQGNIDVSQTYAAFSPMGQKWAEWVMNSGFRRLLQLNWPLFYGDSDMRLMADVLAELKKDYQQNTMSDNAFVVILTSRESGDWQGLISYLEKRGIAYVDYKDLEITSYIKGRHTLHPKNPHYSGAVNRIFAEILSEDIKPLLPR